MTSDTSSAQAQRPNAGEGCEDPRAERPWDSDDKDSEVPRRRVTVALSTENINDSQKRTRCTYYSPNPRLSVLFSLIRPLFLPVLPKGCRITEGLL